MQILFNPFSPMKAKSWVCFYPAEGKEQVVSTRLMSTFAKKGPPSWTSYETQLTAAVLKMHKAIWHPASAKEGLQ